MNYRSYRDQTQHYFSREHTGIPNRPITGAANWLRDDLQRSTDTWVHHLSGDDIDEINRAIAATRKQNLALTEITRESFPLPSLTVQLSRMSESLIDGLGVVLIKGLPLDSWSPEETERAYWGLGHHIGLPGAQNLDNELLGHVTDYREDVAEETIRLYRTNSNIRFHCDAADVVGLLCLHPAKAGGQSRIISTVAMFNRLLNEHPSMAPRLFSPFRIDNREGKPNQRTPYGQVTPCCFDGTHLNTFYHSDYFRSISRHEGVSLEADEQFILDFYDALGEDPEFYFDMWLERGDIQFISNHTVAHARTAYTDHDEAERQRHLLRLWISLDGTHA